MRLRFVNDVLCTHVTFVGLITKVYPDAMIDTGAFKTCLPLQDCRELNLSFTGGTYMASGLYGTGNLPVYTCQLDFNDNDLHFIEILGTPDGQPLIGRDILTKYRLDIDWTRRIANATRLLS
jgi:predicted aspartyl protease